MIWGMDACVLLNIFIIATVFVLYTNAQHPSRAYLPQGSQGSQNLLGSHPSSLGGIGGSGDTGNRRPQQQAEKNAETLKQDQAIGGDGSYQFGFETSNGIKAEETGNIAQAQGGFSYKGDDGFEYTITYTAGEGGFRPQGAHLPIAPPTPEAILEALRKNEQDEAAGIFDDGKYRPDQHSGGQNRPTQGYLPPQGNRPNQGYQY